MITVNKSALSDSDESGEAIMPEVGDMVDLGKAKAKVASIDGDTYSLEILEVNGQPATYAEKAEMEDDSGESDDSDEMPDANAAKPDDMEAMRAILMKKAERADKKAGF